jgi:hypothetical protein
MVPGLLRQAGAADVEILAPFARDFYREIGESAPPDALERAISEGRLFVWCDSEDRIVSMAAWAGLTPNGVRVNFVYTPPTQRARGFASNCVAALTRRLLESGRRFVFLFTDLTNPISNRVYQSIGYAQIVQHQAIHFDPTR